jgi:hypothetical protein
MKVILNTKGLHIHSFYCNTQEEGGEILVAISRKNFRGKGTFISRR